MKIYEQADKSNDKFVYSWILDGFKKNDTVKLEGWRWIKGRPGVFVTNDQNLAECTSTKLSAIIMSNGTHAAINAPAKLCM